MVACQEFVGIFPLQVKQKRKLYTFLGKIAHKKFFCNLLPYYYCTKQFGGASLYYPHGQELAWSLQTMHVQWYKTSSLAKKKHYMT